MGATEKRDENARPVISLHASSRRDLYSNEEWQLVQQAKRQHCSTTAAAKRALKVATETTQVASDMLGELYSQGQQLDRAAHGVEQIGEDVKHAGRIVAFMSRFCCFRCCAADPDLELDARRASLVQQQRMAGVLAAQGAADAYAAKRQAVDAAVATAGQQQNSGPRIAAVRGATWQRRAAAGAATPAYGAPELGAGLHAEDREELAAETAKQESLLDQIDAAVGGLKAMSLAMGQELEEQAPKLDSLQQRTEDTGLAIRSVAGGAAKLAGRPPPRRQGQEAAGWRADQDAANAAVARAVQAGSVAARRYGVR